MAATIREFVFYIRAENQASAVLRRVAADIRGLPSNKIIRIQEQYARSTTRMLESGNKIVKAQDLGLTNVKSSLAARQAEVAAQLKMAQAAEKRNNLEQQAKRNLVAQDALTTRIATSQTRLNNMTDFNGQKQVQNAVKRNALAREANNLQLAQARNAQNIAKAEQALTVAQSKLGSARQAGTYSMRLKNVTIAKNELAILGMQERMLQVDEDGVRLKSELLDAEFKNQAASAARLAESIQILRTQLSALGVDEELIQSRINQLTLSFKAQELAMAANAAAMRTEHFANVAASISRMASVVRLASLITAAGFGLMAKSAANFETQATLAATQARPVGSPISATATITRGLNDEILKQMKQFPAASAEMANSFYEIFSGTNVQNVKQAGDMLRVFNQMAVAGGTDLKTMTDAGISLFNNFPHEFKNMTDAANQFFAAVRYARTTPAQFANSLSNVLPVAKAAGLTFRDVADAMGLITRQTSGRVTSRDTTGLARLIEMFARPDAIKGLHKFGIEVKDAQGKMRPLLDVMTEIYNKFVLTGKLKPGPDTLNFFKTITRAGSETGKGGTMGTIQGRRIFDYLITNMPAYHKVAMQINSDNNEFTRSYAAMAKTPGVEWKVLVNQLKALAIVLGREAIPAFIKMGQPIANLMHWFDGLSTNTKHLLSTILVFASVGGIFAATLTKWIAGFAGLGIQLGIIGKGKNLEKLASSAGSARLAMALMLSGLALVVAAFVLFPHQTKTVTDALGGLHNILIVLAAAFAAFKLAPLLAALVDIAPAAAAAATGLAAVAAGETVVVTESVAASGALALLFNPYVLAGLAAVAVGIWLFSKRATQAEKDVKKLQHTLDQLKSSTIALPQLKLDLSAAELNVKNAKAAMKGLVPGSLQYYNALQTLKQAYLDLTKAQDAYTEGVGKRNRAEQHSVASFLRIAGNIDKKNQPAIPGFTGRGPTTPGSRAGIASNLTNNKSEILRKNLRDVNAELEKVAQWRWDHGDKIWAHNILLVQQLWNLLGHVPTPKEIKLLMNNKNIKAQLIDFINQLPASVASQVANSGTIMGNAQGQAWVNAGTEKILSWIRDMQYQLQLAIDLSLPSTTNPIATSIPENDPNAVSSQAAVKAQKAAATAAQKDAKYIAALTRVGQLDRTYQAHGGLANARAYYNALTTLNKQFSSDAYRAYTSDYLSKIESADKNSASTAAKTAKTKVNNMKTIWTNAAKALQTMYQGLQTQNESSFGTLFSGPFMNSARMQNEITWGYKPTGKDLLNDLKSQVANFRHWRTAINKLRGKKNVPFELVQQILAIGPSALPQLQALLSLSDKDLQTYFHVFKMAEVSTPKHKSLIDIATGEDMQAQIEHFRTFGQAAALAMLQGLRDEKTPLLKFFENLIAEWFPGLVKAAKGAPKPVIKGSAGPDNPGTVKPITTAKPTRHGKPGHGGSGRTVQSARSADIVRVVRAGRNITFNSTRNHDIDHNIDLANRSMQTRTTNFNAVPKVPVMGNLPITPTVPTIPAATTSTSGGRSNAMVRTLQSATALSATPPQSDGAPITSGSGMWLDKAPPKIHLSFNQAVALKKAEEKYARAELTKKYGKKFTSLPGWAQKQAINKLIKPDKADPRMAGWTPEQRAQVAKLAQDNQGGVAGVMLRQIATSLVPSQLVKVSENLQAGRPALKGVTASKATKDLVNAAVNFLPPDRIIGLAAIAGKVGTGVKVERAAATGAKVVTHLPPGTVKEPHFITGYHGSPIPNFKKFSSSKMKPGTYGKGAYFTTNPYLASNYAGKTGHIKQVSVDVSRFYRASDRQTSMYDSTRAAILKQLLPEDLKLFRSMESLQGPHEPSTGALYQTLQEMGNYKLGDRTEQALKYRAEGREYANQILQELGYTGIMNTDGADIAVAFKGAQLKPSVKPVAIPAKVPKAKVVPVSPVPTRPVPKVKTVTHADNVKRRYSPVPVITPIRDTPQWATVYHGTGETFAKHDINKSKYDFDLGPGVQLTTDPSTIGHVGKFGKAPQVRIEHIDMSRIFNASKSVADPKNISALIAKTKKVLTPEQWEIFKSGKYLNPRASAADPHGAMHGPGIPKYSYHPLENVKSYNDFLMQLRYVDYAFRTGGGRNLTRDTLERLGYEGVQKDKNITVFNPKNVHSKFPARNIKQTNLPGMGKTPKYVTAYYGTGKAYGKLDINKFSHDNSFGRAVYLTDNPRYASAYTHPDDISPNIRIAKIDTSRLFSATHKQIGPSERAIFSTHLKGVMSNRDWASLHKSGFNPNNTMDLYNQLVKFGNEKRYKVADANAQLGLHEKAAKLPPVGIDYANQILQKMGYEGISFPQGVSRGAKPGQVVPTNIYAIFDPKKVKSVGERTTTRHGAGMGMAYDAAGKAVNTNIGSAATSVALAGAFTAGLNYRRDTKPDPKRVGGELPWSMYATHTSKSHEPVGGWAKNRPGGDGGGTTQYHDHFDFSHSTLGHDAEEELKKKVRKATFTKRSRDT